MCRVAAASASAVASSASRRANRFGCGSGACRPVRQRPFVCLFGSAQLLRERIAGHGTLRHLSVVLCAMLRELCGRLRLLGRMLPLRVLERRLRVGQDLREGVTAGDFLREPDFELAVALRRFRGRLLFGPGALFGLLERGLGAGQFELERVPGRGRLCKRGDEFGVALGESLGCDSGAGRPVSARPVHVLLRLCATAVRAYRGPQHSAPPQRRTAPDAPRVGQPPSSAGTHAAAPRPRAPRARRIGSARGCPGW